MITTGRVLITCPGAKKRKKEDGEEARTLSVLERHTIKRWYDTKDQKLVAEKGLIYITERNLSSEARTYHNENKDAHATTHTQLGNLAAKQDATHGLLAHVVTRIDLAMAEIRQTAHGGDETPMPPARQAKIERDLAQHVGEDHPPECERDGRDKSVKLSARPKIESGLAQHVAEHTEQASIWRKQRIPATAESHHLPEWVGSRSEQVEAKKEQAPNTNAQRRGTVAYATFALFTEHHNDAFLGRLAVRSR